ncbi:hypothetical protein Bbelb_221680 [Branchiostoma belcheri]|nr:hypothetical protein Bbelb_221680 [Branchiostoma belcheri]
MFSAPPRLAARGPQQRSVVATGGFPGVSPADRIDSVPRTVSYRCPFPCDESSCQVLEGLKSPGAEFRSFSDVTPTDVTNYTDTLTRILGGYSCRKRVPTSLEPRVVAPDRLDCQPYGVPRGHAGSRSAAMRCGPGRETCRREASEPHRAAVVAPAGAWCC